MTCAALLCIDQNGEILMRERYREGSARSAKNILSVIEKTKADNEVILVFLHRSVDGDCVGSASGIAGMARALGAEAYVAIQEELPVTMEFMQLDDLFFRTDVDSPLAEEYRTCGTIGGKKVGAAIATDCSEGSRMGLCGEIFESIEPKIVVDHHASVTTREDNYWVDPDSSSACELVFYVAEQMAQLTGKALNELLQPRIAKAVLSGIVTDTGRFTFKNTHPETLESAGQLIGLGGDISEACYNLFDRKTKEKFLMSAKARSLVNFYCDGKFAMSVVPYELFAELNAGPDSVDDVVSAIRDIDGVELAIVLRQLENGEIRANIRSQDYFDCSEFAGSFGGGGHIRAAGFTVKNGDINEVADEIIKRVQAAI